MNKYNLIIGGIIIALLLGVGVFSGWKLHETYRPCPTITHDTIKVTDPYWHHIADSLAGLPVKERIKWLPQDTLYIPGDTVLADVDTAAILKDYFSVYEYSHLFETDTLDAIVSTRVTKNKPIWYGLDYKFNIPFTTVNNTTNITTEVVPRNMLLLGLSIPIYHYGVDSVAYNYRNNMSIDLTWASTKGYIGAGFQPFDKTLSIKLGTILYRKK